MVEMNGELFHSTLLEHHIAVLQLICMKTPSDTRLSGGTEWDVLECRYENTERRAAAVGKKGLGYLGMGVSGGEEGARNGML